MEIANVVAIPLDNGHLILDLQASVSVIGNGTFTPAIIPYKLVVKALASSAETQKLIINMFCNMTIVLIELMYIVFAPFDWTRGLSPVYF